jgi:Tfp pilus assembly protein PilN
MIRINLLPGQQRPKAKRGAAVGGGGGGGSLSTIMLGMGALVGLVVIVGMYFMRAGEVERKQKEVADLQSKKDSLEKTKKEVEDYQKQKEILDQRIAVIQDLQRSRAGGQELLDVVATTVNKVDSLWLTSMARKGNSLTIEGTAASISAVANLVTQLKQAGYFDKVEIKETRQDDRNKAVQVFIFNVSADFVLPGIKGTGATGAATAAAPQKKG